MKRLKFLCLSSFILFTCSSVNKLQNSACRENLAFKKKFFHDISIVEEYTIQNTTITKQHEITDRVFFKALNFVSKYSKVPIGNIYNYQIGYGSVDKFEVEKKKWLNWYDANKCNNIH